jgi:hypothetical protein
VLQGLAAHVLPAQPDTLRRLVPGLQGSLVDVERTQTLVEQVFRFGDLFTEDTLELDPSSQSVAGSLAIPFLELGQSYAALGDEARTLEYFRKAFHLSPNPAVAAVISEIESIGLDAVLRRGRTPPDQP